MYHDSLWYVLFEDKNKVSECAQRTEQLTLEV